MHVFIFHKERNIPLRFLRPPSPQIITEINAENVSKTLQILQLWKIKLSVVSTSPQYISYVNIVIIIELSVFLVR